MNWHSIVAWAAATAAAAIAWAAHEAARGRHPARDAGPFWSRIFLRLGWLMLGIWLSIAAESAVSFWRKGYHLEFDRALESAWAYWLALLLPFAFWGGLILLGLRDPRGRDSHPDWLAGSISTSPGREWVLCCAAPFAIPLFWYGPSRLGLREDGYAAALWGALAAATISLVAVALSGPQRTAVRKEAAVSPAPASALPPPWPEAMAEQGIELGALRRWEGSRPNRRVQEGARDFEARLRVLGAREVAPQVIDAVHSALSPAGAASPYTLLLGPDDCGQLEAVALASGELAMFGRQSTLIVTPRPDPELCARLARWMPKPVHENQPGPTVIELRAVTSLENSVAIWVTDAATLSNDLMMRLSDPAIVARIGLVVWWDVHLYTGVLAANVWAISRRLHRVVTGKGRRDTRALVFLRDSAHTGAQMASFVRRLLPYPFAPDREIHVDRSFARNMVAHEIRGHSGYFEKNPNSPISRRVSHRLVVSAVTSASAGWPTFVAGGAEITDSEREEVLEKYTAAHPSENLLVASSAEAGARILEADDADLLALTEMICQGGRATHPELPHHVGIIAPESPYANYVLSCLAKGRMPPASRRLIGAEGHPEIYRRHLILALTEQEDTRTGLRETLLWEEAVLHQTIEEIDRQGKLSRREVRFIDASGRRVIEYVYSSRLERNDERRPLDTVEDSLRFVRVATEPGNTPMCVDERRLAIEAYPGRVFMAGGERYRVRDWKTEQLGWVECQREALQARTWRERVSRISSIERRGEERTVSGRGILLKQYPAGVRYSEDITGFVRREYDIMNGTHRDRRQWIEPLTTNFETSALLVQLVPEPGGAAILALCQALRHMLPAHLGVEADAVEVVPLEGKFIDGQQAVGFAIVDLYPRGIGLVEAICDDPQWTLITLGCVLDWLTDLAAGAKTPLPSPFDSPLALATTGGGESGSAALELLKQIVPEPARERRGTGAGGR